MRIRVLENLSPVIFNSLGSMQSSKDTSLASNLDIERIYSLNN